MTTTPFVFDAYGTLLDVDAAARDAVARHPALLQDKWQDLSASWRHRQLSYSWLRSLMGRYTPFWQITCDALDVTLEEMNLSAPDLRDDLLQLYLNLGAYQEVPGVLAELKAQGHQLAVLSNGNPEMLEAALTSAGIYDLFDVVLSVDPLECYKPDPRVYALATSYFDCAASDIRFFSSNNWDIAGAGSFGFKTIWVNRLNKTWDDLPEAPEKTVQSLAEAAAFLK